MSIFSFPFDSVSAANPDRAANSLVFASYLKAFFTDGVFPVLPQMTDMNQLAVRPMNTLGMGVQIDTGIALIDGRMYWQDEIVTRTLDQSDGTLDRIDRIVVRKNLNIEFRKNEIYVLKGISGVNPVAPALTVNNVVKEISLAQIYVRAGATAIQASDITDERADTSICGYVTNVLGQVDTSVMNAQFMSWFESIRNVLSGDVAGNLKNEIDSKADQAKIIDDIHDLKAVTETGYITGALPFVGLCNSLSSHFSINTTKYVNDSLATAIGKLLEGLPEVGSYSGRFKCAEGWYTIHCFYAADGGWNSGYVSNIANIDAYTFNAKAGADAVLKKLGNMERTLIGSMNGVSSKTFDCTAIENWENLTNENFAVIPTGLASSGGAEGNLGAQGTISASASPKLSYDANTGVLTVSGMSCSNQSVWGSSQDGVTTTKTSANLNADIYCFHT